MLKSLCRPSGAGVRRLMAPWGSTLADQPLFPSPTPCLVSGHCGPVPLRHGHAANAAACAKTDCSYSVPMAHERFQSA